jgi:hypothetical protein
MRAVLEVLRRRSRSFNCLCYCFHHEGVVMVIVRRSGLSENGGYGLF